MPYEISTFQLPSGAPAVRVKVTGTLQGDEAVSMMKQWDAGQPLYGLPAVVLTQEMRAMTPEARSFFGNWKPVAPTEWYAIVVTSPLIRVISNFINRVSGSPRRRLFSNEVDAIRWLDERALESRAK